MEARRWKLAGRREVAKGTMEFTFDPDGAFAYEAGQNMDYELPTLAVPDDGKGRIRTFSLVRAPDVGIPTATTRMTGSAFKETLARMPIGIELPVVGPNGTFTLPRESKRPLVFHAGGIGITPFFSLVEDATLRKLPHRITLVYSNRAPSSAVYLAEFQAFEKQNRNFHLAATMTSPEGETWDGPVGVIDDIFLTKNVPGLRESAHYIAGPPALVGVLRKILTEADIEDAFIKTEEFSGY
jgi:ferredoxin-NADP reductase